MYNVREDIRVAAVTDGYGRGDTSCHDGLDIGLNTS